jgi:hypothetical protein
LAREEVVRLLAEGGCDEVALGVETGNAVLRRRLLRREMDNQLLIDTFRRLEEAGIRTHSFNMVGVPHEKMQNSLETIKLNAVLKKKWRMPELRITIFHPYAGTQLHDEARKQGLLTDRRVTDYADDTVLNLDSMSRHQIRFVARFFRLLVVVYQKLLRDLGKPGLLGAGMLDRLLLSRLARQTIFPVANQAYPWGLKLLRLLKMHDNPLPTSPVTATVQEQAADHAGPAADARRPPQAVDLASDVSVMIRQPTGDTVLTKTATDLNQSRGREEAVQAPPPAISHRP